MLPKEAEKIAKSKTIGLNWAIFNALRYFFQYFIPAKTTI